MSVQIGDTPARLALLFDDEHGAMLLVGGKRGAVQIHVTPTGLTRLVDEWDAKRARAVLFPETIDHQLEPA